MGTPLCESDLNILFKIHDDEIKDRIQERDFIKAIDPKSTTFK